MLDEKYDRMMLEKGFRELLCSKEWQGVAGFIGTAGWRKYDECNGKMFPRQKCCTCIGICVVVGSEMGHDRSGTATRRGFRSQVRQGVMHCRQKDVAKRQSEGYWQSHLPQT